MTWIASFIWFIKASYDFKQGNRDLYFWIHVIPFAVEHANFMRRWSALTEEQKEAWYMGETVDTISPRF